MGTAGRRIDRSVERNTGTQPHSRPPFCAAVSLCASSETGQRCSSRPIWQCAAITRLRPDMGFFSAKTWRSIEIDRVPVRHAPDIAFEIISRVKTTASETATTINRKVQAYLAWGVHEVWLIYPETRTVEVHVPGSARTLSETRASDIHHSFPAGSIQISELFEDL